MDLVIIGLCGQSVFLSVDHFHRPEETLHAHDLFAEPGGKGYNQAVAAARMGASVAFAGAVGPDADGETITCILLDLTTNDYEKLFSVKSAAAFDTEKTELIKGTAASAISLKGALQAYVDAAAEDDAAKIFIQQSGVLN